MKGCFACNDSTTLPYIFGEERTAQIASEVALCEAVITSENQSVIAEQSTIETDAYRSYRKPLSEKYNHNWDVFDADKEMLVWLHTVISNAKSFVQDTFHGLDALHLQRYLDEFCWRFNRRYRQDSIFFDLLRSVVNAPIASYAELRG